MEPLTPETSEIGGGSPAPAFARLRRTPQPGMRRPASRPFCLRESGIILKESLHSAALSDIR